MLSTAQLRAAWGRPCKGKKVSYKLHGDGIVNIAPAILDATTALNKVLIKWGYITRAADTGAFNCRKISGGTGDSLHAYAIALDINWRTNLFGPKLVTDMPRGMVDEILAIRTNSGAQVWRWGGDFRTVKDAMHFEIACAPRDISSGIQGQRPAPSPLPTPPPIPPGAQEEDEMRYIKADADYYAISGETYRKLTPAQYEKRRNLAALSGAPLNLTTMHPWALAAFLMEFQMVALPPTK